jgi:hypothetical protein
MMRKKRKQLPQAPQAPSKNWQPSVQELAEAAAFARKAGPAAAALFNADRVRQEGEEVSGQPRPVRIKAIGS